MEITSISGAAGYSGSEPREVKPVVKTVDNSQGSDVMQEDAYKAGMTGVEETVNPQQEEATIKDVKEINKIINRNTVAEFGYNEPTKRITIKIKDRETNQVIKEIPSEKALEMLAKAWELAGIMVDEKR